METPDHPIGPFVEDHEYDERQKERYVDTLARAPLKLREAVSGLSEQQLDVKYRNWSIRQIAHHMADSHTHCYIRFKWALTENQPTIKAYDEAVWSEVVDARTGDVEASLQMLAGVHARWVQLIRMMSDEEFLRTFHHPEFDEVVVLRHALPYYAWHCRHHTGQILWLRENRM